MPGLNQPTNGWMDKWGACKICGGEIPHGHFDDCDVYKMSQTINSLQRTLKLIASYAEDSEYEGCCPYGCDCPRIAKEALNEQQ